VKKLSAIALSQQIPVNPIERVMPFLTANAVIWAEAYWEDSTGRRNTGFSCQQ
jgi:hypothetical protein